MKFILAIAFFVYNLSSSGYASADQNYLGYAIPSTCPPRSVDLFTVLRKNGFTTFVDLIVKAGLDEIYSQDRPYLILAPTNEAFAAIDPATLATILYDVKLLRDFLTYHLVLFREPSNIVSAILHELTLPTVQGGVVRFNVYRKQGPSIATEEIATANGARLLKAIPAGDSFVYAIGRVLNLDELSSNNSLINFLKKNKDFSIFLNIYESLGITESSVRVDLKTTFLPTDAAFKQAFSVDALNSLFANTRQLVTVLNAHTASGTFYTAGLWDGPFTLFSGAVAKVTKSPGGSITVGGAEIIVPDITVIDGVIQIVDALVQTGPIPGQNQCTLY